MIKSLLFYSVTERINTKDLVDNLCAYNKSGIAASADTAFHWTELNQHVPDKVMEVQPGRFIFRALTLTKKIDSSAFNQLVQDKCDEITEAEGHKPGRRERNQIKEDIRAKLLPNTPPAPKYTFVLYDQAAALLAVATSSDKEADGITAHLRELLGTLQIVPLKSKMNSIYEATNFAKGSWHPSNEQDRPLLEKDFLLHGHVAFTGEDKQKVIISHFDRETLYQEVERIYRESHIKLKQFDIQTVDEMHFMRITDTYKVSQIKHADLIDEKRLDNMGEDDTADSIFQADGIFAFETLHLAYRALTELIGLSPVDEEDGEEGKTETVDDDPLYEQAKSFVIESQKATTSALQRKLRIGYNRAANLLISMEQEHIVSEPVNGVRTVLIEAQ